MATIIEQWIVQFAQLREDFSLSAFDELARFSDEAQALKTVATLRTNCVVYRCVTLSEALALSVEESAAFDSAPDTLDD